MYGDEEDFPKNNITFRYAGFGILFFELVELKYVQLKSKYDLKTVKGFIRSLRLRFILSSLVHSAEHFIST